MLAFKWNNDFPQLTLRLASSSVSVEFERTDDFWRICNGFDAAAAITECRINAFWQWILLSS